MQLATKALWIMERNSNQDLSLTEVAQACGVSRSHLAHAFASTTGMPAMRYLRARRLGRAARALAAGAPDILSVAFDAGYGSHEAFTRAFRDEFGLTPESVRERGTTADLKITEAPPLASGDTRPQLVPRYETQGPLRIVGLPALYARATTVGIPAQWQSFMEACDDVPYQIDEIPVGVTEPPDEDGNFRYLCGIEVERFGKIPVGMETVSIGPARYAVFDHDTHVSGLYDTYDRIWNEALSEAGQLVADTPVVERHNATFDPTTGEGGLTIWVPLADAAPLALNRNLETVRAYDRYAPNTKTMTATAAELLDAFAANLPPGGSILEIGSGPGWDADYFEARGFSVMRTDASSQFVALQRERGKSARQLNIVTDRLGGPYDGVLMLYVAQHIDDDLLPGCLTKLAASLRPGGSVLLTYRDGDGQSTERGGSGNYHTALRLPALFRGMLDAAGLISKWERPLADDEGDWQAILGQRP